MSEAVVDQHHPRNGSHRGQSLVEFVLVLPLLLVLLLGIADFGRVFAAGITAQAAARNGAEAAALERLRNKPTTPGDPAYYQRLHDIAAEVACNEARLLPNTTFNSADSTCASMPVIAACVQDGNDPHCGDLASGFTGTVPPGCSRVASGWDGLSGGAIGSHSVEVRVCYRFTTLMPLNFAMPFNAGLTLGDVFLFKQHAFVVDCPPGDVLTC